MPSLSIISEINLRKSFDFIVLLINPISLGMCSLKIIRPTEVSIKLSSPSLTYSGILILTLAFK